MMNRTEERDMKPQHDDVFVIGDLETLKVVADPLRLQILEGLRGSPRTVKDLAADLGLSATRLYYHVNLLEQHGLISVTDTRLVSGIIEKHYQTTADRLTVDRALLGPDRPLQDEGIEVLLSVILDEARGEIRRSIREGWIDVGDDPMRAEDLVLGRHWLRLTPDQVRDYLDRFKQLQIEFDEIAAGNGGDAQVYELLLGFYPVERRSNRAGPAAQGTHGLLASDGESEEK